MRLRLCVLLLSCLPVFAHGLARADDHDHDHSKDKIKCKKASTDPAIEEFVFILPSPKKSCTSKKAFRTSVVDFYKWYLQNESRISAGMVRDSGSKDLVPPFNISWQTLHEYFEFIQKNYPAWIDDIESDGFGENSATGYNTAKESGDKNPAAGVPHFNLPNTVN